MGRLRPWSNLPPVLQCSRYRRLLEQQNTATNAATDTSSDDATDTLVLGYDSTRFEKSKKSKRKQAQQSSATGSGGGKRSQRKKDCTRQLIQDSFQELMSYSCGQCGHVQTLQVCGLLKLTLYKPLPVQ